MTEIKHRILLVSDMHYTTDLSDKEMKKISPDANVSAAAGTAFGYTQKEKIDKVLEAVIKENSKQKLDAVLVLGDLSIDDYNCRHLPDNYCEKFKKECMDKFPCESYAIAGNHDSYPDEVWERIFGYKRQFSVKIGNAVFIMLDTFNSVPAYDAGGSEYSYVDTDFLKEELKKYPQETIFLCAHHIDEYEESEELKQILLNNERIVCLFRGHTHHNRVLFCEELGNKFLIDIGGYAYSGKYIDGKYTFNIFDEAWAWGYEILEIGNDTMRMYHVKPELQYHAGNGDFLQKREISGYMELKIQGV